MKRRSLGKGLSELGVNELLGGSSDTLQKEGLTDLTTLPIAALKPGRYQPRRQMNPEALEELANSIRSQGIIQPIVVRRLNDGYEIIAGERRWRAAQLANLTAVPVVIRDMDNETALAISLIENIQRQDLNSMEEAIALQRLIEEFHMTHQEVAVAVGLSRASVTNTLRLLKLNSDVQTLVESGKLDMGHARALLALEGDQQSEIAHKIVVDALSVRETERLIRKLQQSVEKKPESVLSSPDVDRLQQNLSQRLRTTVNIKQGGRGKGKLIIHYKNTDQLDDILKRIQ